MYPATCISSLSFKMCCDGPGLDPIWPLLICWESEVWTQRAPVGHLTRWGWGAAEAGCAQNTSAGAFGALQKGRGREADRNRRSRTHRGMRVRYVKTLAKASSGMSLKAEHSGRVMMTLESSPRPPGKKDISSQLQIRLMCFWVTLVTKNSGEGERFKPNSW